MKFAHNEDEEFLFEVHCYVDCEIYRKSNGTLIARYGPLPEEYISRHENNPPQLPDQFWGMVFQKIERRKLAVSA